MMMKMIERVSPTGILGFPVAPFNQQDRLDENALIENINLLVNEGLSSIFVCAGAGELQSLSQKEYEQMVEIAVSVVGGKVPVYAGVGGNISTALEFAAIGQKKGVDGFLLMPPYLINGEQEGLFQYFSRVIQSTDCNVIIYQRDNAILNAQTIQRLLDYPQLVGFKDGFGNMELNIELTQSIGGRLEWINGMPFAEVTMPAYAGIGYKTYSSAISNYIPHISRLFYQSLFTDDKATMNKLYHDVIFPINNIRKQKKGYAVSLIKAGMDIVGLNVGQSVRPPLIPVEKEHYRQLELILNRTMELYPR
jgi:5-dehydro-4-deoxyglucarate dehydratase